MKQIFLQSFKIKGYFLSVHKNNILSFYPHSTRSIGLGRLGQNRGAALRLDPAHLAGLGEAAALVQGHHGHSSVQVSETTSICVLVIPRVTGA